MATLRDFFNKMKNTNLFNRVTGNQPEMDAIQLDEYGDIDPVESASQTLGIKQMTTPLTMRDRLLGRKMTSDVQTYDDDGNAQMQTLTNYRPGLFNNLAAGFRENYTTPISSENFGNGQGKGLGYRLGEGIGTVARIFESPLGRAAITAGLVGANGGSGLEALAYGGQAGLINQNRRSSDALYRQQLKDQYGYTDDQLNRIRGYIDTNTFNSLTKSQNSAMNIAIRQQATESMNKLRELQAQKLEIQNSTLPEMQKAKLLQEITKAEHAEEMQLAKINYYNNSAALGWANFGLKADKAEREAELDALKRDIIESLKGGNKVVPTNTPTPTPNNNQTKGKAF